MGRTLSATPYSLLAVPVAVLFLADVLDRDDVFVIGGVEHDHALGRAAGDADALDRAADQLALVGDQHDLVGVFHRERGHQIAVAVVDARGDDAFAAAARGAVLVGRGPLAVAVHGDGEHDLLLCRHLGIALLGELEAAGSLLVLRIHRYLFSRGFAGDRAAHLQ